MFTSTVTFIWRQLESGIATAAVGISANTELFTVTVVQITAACRTQFEITRCRKKINQSWFNFTGLPNLNCLQLS